MITFEDFKKIEITVGKILSAEKIAETDKLLRLTVDFAEEKPRQIISGISMYFPNPAAELVGRKCMFVTNLEPRIIRGYESNGMLLAVNADISAVDLTGATSETVGITSPGMFSLLEPHPDIPQGTKAK
jgi:methionine--tRNA ligase beta chain